MCTCTDISATSCSLSSCRTDCAGAGAGAVVRQDPGVQHERARQALAELASQSLPGAQEGSAAEQAAQPAPVHQLASATTQPQTGTQEGTGCGLPTGSTQRQSGVLDSSGLGESPRSTQPQLGTEGASGFEECPANTQPQWGMEGVGPQSGSGAGLSPGSRQLQSGREGGGGQTTQPHVPGPHSPLPHQAVSDLNTGQVRCSGFVVMHAAAYHHDASPACCQCRRACNAKQPNL